VHPEPGLATRYRAQSVAPWKATERQSRGRRSRVRRPRTAALAAAVAAALAGVFLVAGCGDDSRPTPIEIKGGESGAVRPVAGFPVIATKNTTRVAGDSPVEDAAAVAAAVYPALGGGRRPAAVTLVQDDDWRAGVAAAVLVASPLRAPILLTDGDQVPGPTEDALDGLRPTGAASAGGIQAISIGGAAKPAGLRVKRISGDGPFELAAAIDAYRTQLAGRPSGHIVVVSASEPQIAMPAAGWAAKSGDSVLFATTDELPPATRAAIARHARPDIYVLGPPKAIGDPVVAKLKKLGRVKRVGGENPVENAIAFARYSDGSFGWGIRDPGHGLVIANAERELDAAAAAPLSSSGTYGPLLLTESADELPESLEDYLLDIQPGYRTDPVRGVYNHAWLMGDERAIGAGLQARIDALTEIVRVREPSS
jgi:putative cell wall-binding protein